MIEVCLLTGPSGAGASSAKFVFEELGYYVMENVPSPLAESLFDTIIHKNGVITSKYCLIVPLMTAKKFIEEAKKHENEITFNLILLSASKEEILKRYVLSRHAHPRTSLENISLEDAIDIDIKEANEFIPDANIYINNTGITVKTLRLMLYSKLTGSERKDITAVTFMSYGLKNGIPQGLDMSIDTRVLPNPYWVETLKDKTGEDKEIIDYLESFPLTKDFLKKTTEYLDFFISEMQKEGRSNYLIGVACTGGQHRSTYVANYLCNYFKDKYQTAVIHRDTPELNK